MADEMIEEGKTWPPAPVADSTPQNLQVEILKWNFLIGRWTILALIPQLVISIIATIARLYAFLQEFHYKVTSAWNFESYHFLWAMPGTFIDDIAGTLSFIWLFTGFLAVLKKSDSIQKAVKNTILISLVVVRLFVIPSIYRDMLERLTTIDFRGETVKEPDSFAVLIGMVWITALCSTSDWFVANLIEPFQKGHQYSLYWYGLGEIGEIAGTLSILNFLLILLKVRKSMKSNGFRD